MSLPRIVPTLGYHDAGAAIDWLVAALGFEVRSRQDDDDGRVLHAELWHDGAAVMLGSLDADAPPRPGGAGTHGVYLVVDDVDAVFARARDLAAEVVWTPHDTPFGTRRARVVDREGYEWSIGSYRPDPDPPW